MKIVTQIKSTAGQTTGDCNMVSEKMKLCDKITEVIHFSKPDFFFFDFFPSHFSALFLSTQLLNYKI